MELLDGERLIYEGRPSWRAMLAFYLKGIAAAVVPVIAVVVANGIFDADIPTWWIVALVLAILAVVFLRGWLIRLATRYVITDRRLVVRRGILSRREDSTHIDRIQNVNVNQTVFQRMLRVGDVDFDTAGSDHHDADFSFLGINSPFELRHRIDTEVRARAGEYGRGAPGGL